MPWDVKLTRPVSGSVIIAGPYDEKEEAQMHATRLKLQERDARQAQVDALSKDFPPLDDSASDEEKADYAFNKQKAERDLKKFLADTESTYEVMPYKRGGI